MVSITIVMQVCFYGIHATEISSRKKQTSAKMINYKTGHPPKRPSLAFVTIILRDSSFQTYEGSVQLGLAQAIAAVARHDTL